jgi:N-hydroxyarylamine O-acetyltransferase
MANSRFSLTEYFAHIGLPDYQPKPTFACLRDIVWQHLLTFPYQNSRLFKEGKKPAEKRQMASLDPDVIFDEMVRKQMPAYCYQNNGLLYAALTRVGFNISRHFSKVILEARDTINPAAIAQQHDTHIALVVVIGKKSYLLDTGFSNESLREPLPLTAGIKKLGSDEYLLEEFDDHWRLNSLRYGQDRTAYWFCLYRFDKHVVNNKEIEMKHRDLYFAEPISIRDDLLLFSRVTETKRKYVYWSASEKCGIFRSVKNDGSIRDAKKFDSEAETIKFAEQKFKL